MLVLLWWLWALRELSKIEDGQTWPAEIVAERTQEERLARRLVALGALTALTLGIIYVVLVSSIESAQAAMNVCPLLRDVAPSHYAECVTQNAETFAGANESAHWITIFFWSVVII